MSGLLNELVSNLIWFLITLLGGYGLAKWQQFFSRKRHLYRLFKRRSLKKHQLIFILPETAVTFQQLTPQIVAPRTKLVGYEDTLGFSFLFSFIQLVKVDYVVRLKKLSPDEKMNNLICIGGPAPNNETADFVKSVNTKYQFQISQNKWTIFDSLTNQSYTENNIHDYGLIWKYKSPWNDDCSVVICAGIYEHGTLAACHYFFSKYRDLSRQFKNRNFELILRIDKQAGFPSTTVMTYRAG